MINEVVTYYKFLNPDRQACYGVGAWDLLAKPKDGQPVGKWMPKRTPILCESGYHACRPRDVSHWIGPELWCVELRGEIIAGDNKVVAESARLVRRVEAWNDRTQRIFAADCAEYVLNNFEKERPRDARVRNCIATVRAFAEGNVTLADLMAAQSAACSAAWSAAESAARSAARSAAWSAAQSAACSAAQSAACSAAGSAAWSRQSAHLLELVGEA